MEDHERELVERRVLELKSRCHELVDSIHFPREGDSPVCPCLPARSEDGSMPEQGSSAADCFVNLYRKVSGLGLPDDQLSVVDQQVRRIKREVDALWEHHLMSAVTDIAEAIRVSAIRRDPDARADAAADILTKVYERTLLKCVLNWRGEGDGKFINYLRAAVANVKATHEGELWKRVSRVEPIDIVRDHASEENEYERIDDRLSVESVRKKLVETAGHTGESEVLTLHYDRELTHREIAECRSTTEVNSRLLLHRAMTKLRQFAGVELPLFHTKDFQADICRQSGAVTLKIVCRQASDIANVRIDGITVVLPPAKKLVKREVLEIPLDSHSHRTEEVEIGFEWRGNTWTKRVRLVA